MTRARARTLARGAAALGCTLLTGCYSLRPVRLDGELEPGRVRAYLSDAGVRRVTGPLGEPHEVIDGRLVRATPGELTLLVPSNGASAGFGSDVLYQELRIPTAEIDGLQRRELDRFRTGLTVGAVAAVSGFLLYQSLSGKTGGSGIPGGGGGPPEARLPILRWTLP